MDRRVRRILATAMLVVGMSYGTFGAHVDAGQEETPVVSPGASPTAMSGTGAVFMTITNSGVEDDHLLGGSTDVAQVVEIHEVAEDEGMMRMRPLTDGLAVPAEGAVVLEPGGFHVMLIGLTRDLTSGSTYHLTLSFARAGEVEIDVPVRPRAVVDEAEVATIGNLTISAAYSRPAPMIGEDAPMHGGMAATPAAASH